MDKEAQYKEKFLKDLRLLEEHKTSPEWIAMKYLPCKPLDRPKHCDKHNHFVDECMNCQNICNDGIDWSRLDRPELRGKIAKLIWCESQGDTGWQTSHNFIHKSGICYAVADQILALIIPKEKPPLLSDEDFIRLFTEEQKRQGVPDKYNFPEAIAGNVHYHRMLAQAQRESDIKHYGG